MSGRTIRFELGFDEALVLYEMMESFAADPAREAALRQLISAAEMLALYRVDGAIERTLPELFSPTYAELLQAARLRLDVESGR